MSHESQRQTSASQGRESPFVGVGWPPVNSRQYTLTHERTTIILVYWYAYLIWCVCSWLQWQCIHHELWMTCVPRWTLLKPILFYMSTDKPEQHIPRTVNPTEAAHHQRNPRPRLRHWVVNEGWDTTRPNGPVFVNTCVFVKYVVRVGRSLVSRPENAQLRATKPYYCSKMYYIRSVWHTLVIV